MTSILTEEERSALKAASAMGRAARLRRAEALINPASGLANDYLNLFNEIVMLIEQLPTMPELFEDIERWHPRSYQDYFRASILPGRETALEAYDRLDIRFRGEFEAVVAELDHRSVGGVAAVRRHYRLHGDAQPDALAILCERAGRTIRESLDRATMLVNHGEIVEADAIQQRTDRLLARMHR